MSIKRQRRDRVNFYLDLAETVSNNSTCIYNRCGAVLVNNDTVITTGYTGAPKGRQNCIDMEVCTKDTSGFCRAIHAETNAVLFASRADTHGGSLYVVRIDVDKEGKDVGYVENHDCCEFCKMLLINSGIRDVYIRVSKDEYIRQTVMEWIEKDNTLNPNSSMHR